MTKFKKGDKVVLIKNIDYYEFEKFGNEDIYIEEAKEAKYLTIKTCCLEEGHLEFKEIPQWWKGKWFKKFDTQMELNFDD